MLHDRGGVQKLHVPEFGYFDTLRSQINIGLSLLIWKLLQDYFLIRVARFIDFKIFSMSNIFLTLMVKNVIFLHEDWIYSLIHRVKITFMLKKALIVNLHFSNLWRATFIPEATFINFCDVIQGYVY